MKINLDKYHLLVNNENEMYPIRVDNKTITNSKYKNNIKHESRSRTKI